MKNKEIRYTMNTKYTFKKVPTDSTNFPDDEDDNGGTERSGQKDVVIGDIPDDEENNGEDDGVDEIE